MPKKKTIKRKRSKGIDWSNLLRMEHARITDDQQQQQQQRQLEFDYFEKETTGMARPSTKSRGIKSKKSSTAKAKRGSTRSVSKSTKSSGRTASRAKKAAV